MTDKSYNNNSGPLPLRRRAAVISYRFMYECLSAVEEALYEFELCFRLIFDISTERLVVVIA